VVGPRAALGRRDIVLHDLNWLGPALDGVLPIQVRVRSSQALRPATIEPAGEGGAIVRFDAPEMRVSPGQACVAYDAGLGSRLLGGGFIRRFR
jgi:tRNA-specific 2-thiouridylase